MDAPIQMRNLTTFPIERLCFDLKLEVLEQLEAKDVVELVKVNQGFQWMISSRPSIVFGHHVDDIGFGFDPHGIEAINIKKLNLESLEVSLDVIRHFPFIKNIRSCNQLWMRGNYDSPIDGDYATLLKQLEAVNSLELEDCSPVRLELLSRWSIKIKRYAELPSFLRSVPSIKDLVGHFIETQLNECQLVELNCWEDEEFQFYYNTFIKTHVKCVAILCFDGFVLANQRIVSHGIPSQHPAAVVRICSNLREYMQDAIVVFFKRYPGMKQINRKNHQPFMALAMERSKGSSCPVLTVQTLCFRRNINATRDCIYLVWYSSKMDQASFFLDFFAFYIKPDEMADH